MLVKQKNTGVIKRQSIVHRALAGAARLNGSTECVLRKPRRRHPSGKRHGEPLLTLLLDSRTTGVKQIARQRPSIRYATHKNDFLVPLSPVEDSPGCFFPDLAGKTMSRIAGLQPIKLADMTRFF